MKRFTGLAIATILVSGCATTGNVKVLQEENKKLKSDLTQSLARISSLEADKRDLQKEISVLKHVQSVLRTEKSSRVQESGRLRSQTRAFANQGINSFRDFLKASDLLDYVGGERVQREHIEGAQQLVVDAGNPIPRAGNLTSVGGYFADAGIFSVVILRRIEDALIVVWESQPFEVPRSGESRFEFQASVSVEAGDILGYVFPKKVIIPFDKGTGKARYVDEIVKIGDRIRSSDLRGSNDARAYSVGAYGFLAE